MKPVPPTRLPYEAPRWLTLERVAMTSILWAPASLLVALCSVPLNPVLVLLFLFSAGAQLAGATWAVRSMRIPSTQPRILLPVAACILGTMFGQMFTAPSLILLEPSVRDRILIEAYSWSLSGASEQGHFINALIGGSVAPGDRTLFTVNVVTLLCGIPIVAYQVLAIVILALQRDVTAHDAVDRAIVRAAPLGALAGLITFGLCWGIEARWLGVLFAGVAAVAAMYAQARIVRRRRWLGEVTKGTVPGWTVLERAVQTQVTGPRLFVAQDSPAPGEVRLLARVADEDPYRPSEQAEAVAAVPIARARAGP
jgi:hypothetical protein